MVLSHFVALYSPSAAPNNSSRTDVHGAVSPPSRHAIDFLTPHLVSMGTSAHAFSMLIAHCNTFHQEMISYDGKRMQIGPGLHLDHICGADDVGGFIYMKKINKIQDVIKKKGCFFFFPFQKWFFMKEKRKKGKEVGGGSDSLEHTQSIISIIIYPLW